MDLDPFCPVGITAATMRFLDVFLLHCVLCDSPPDTPQEIAALARNVHRVAERGREPGLRLERNGQTVDLFEWGGQVLVECEPIAAALDGAHGGSAYRDTLAASIAALNDPDLVPSARILKEMEARHEGSYTRFALAQSLLHRSALHGLALAADVQARFERLAQGSIAEQRRIEASDRVPFETYRQEYLAQDLLATQRRDSG